jgi:phosphomevalonate kinase
LVEKIENLTDLEIETPLINDFIDVCSRNLGVAKSSGAGGGDCAIAFFPHPVTISDILLSIGIMPLTITIAKREVV